MSVLDSIKAKAKSQKKHILLPEGTEERTVQAAQRIIEEGIADVPFQAFQRCLNLTTVSLPETVTSIPNWDITTRSLSGRD